MDKHIAVIISLYLSLMGLDDVYGLDRFHENGFCVIEEFIGREDIENLRLVRAQGTSLVRESLIYYIL